MSLMEMIILAAMVVGLVVYLIVKSKNKAASPDENGAQSGVKETVPAVPAPQAAPVIQAGIEEETVAAIMAAISCLIDPDSGARFVVKSINRVKSERPVWCFAGMQQNTRPF